MLPLNSQKALFSGEEANVIRFALSIFLQTDFAGLTSKKEEEKAIKMLKELYEYYIEYPTTMSPEYQQLIRKGVPLAQAVCDYISGMTDQYSTDRFREIYIPEAWKGY